MDRSPWRVRLSLTRAWPLALDGLDREKARHYSSKLKSRFRHVSTGFFNSKCRCRPGADSPQKFAGTCVARIYKMRIRAKQSTIIDTE